MHLLPVERGVIDDGDQAVDLGQSPGDILYLSAADSELAMLADAWKRRAVVDPALPSLRLANYLQLKHHFSVDLYVETMVAQAKVVVMRLLGGRSYWPYGVDTIAQAVRAAGSRLIVLPGCPKPDPSLLALSTIDVHSAEQLWTCLVEGGPRNADALVGCLIAMARGQEPGLSVERLAAAGVYREESPGGSQGTAVLLFYRALLQAGDLAAIDALVETLTARNLAVTAVYVTSLRDPAAVEVLTELFGRRAPDIVLNTTAFAAGLMDELDAFAAGPFGFDAPWLQVVLSGQSREAWESGLSGLPARDVAMHIALPEFDGRITSRAVAFKSDGGFDPLTELRVVRMAPEPDRVAFVADLAANWVRLRKLAAADRRVAIILANYPNVDHRIANAVGLDTPDSAARLLGHLAREGYGIQGAPPNGRDLVDALLSGPTNAKVDDREVRASLPLARYKAAFAQLPETVRCAVTERWGRPEDDHFFADDAFALPVLPLGNVVVAIQPTRGYGLDVKATYHDAALVPPHGYLAFHVWLREAFGADVVVHLGKHGNVEWLPGKALALSAECFPEVALGPMPNIYPFIANDPGEGCQAKRRTAAVVVDHLPPPMTQADSYGVLKTLESSIDEYYEAQRLDRRRAELLATRILQEAESLGLAEDLGLDRRDPPEVQLTKLDAYLCDLKEMQIRGGLHVFGEVPAGEARTDMLLSLVRSPRGTAESDRSMIASLADDLGLAFDPLTADRAEVWNGPRPPYLAAVSAAPWRSVGDTVERLNELARCLIDGRGTVDPSWANTSLVLDEVRHRIGPDLDASGQREIEGVLRGLAGRYVPPGPSGAPTRGRPDVLPTGRNFYALDTRTVPTPAAWDIGRAAAELLVERYFQEHGDWPKAIALSAWGTSNLRTGGDDIAQALALMGAQPVWEPGTRRVTGFDIIPPAKLGRPRIDVTLRISGFFRDAFPGQIALIDSVVRTIAARDELPGENPIAERVRAEADDLSLRGLPLEEARRRATYRIFGSKPGGYGAGLGNVVDSDDWDSLDDLADVFLEWGQHAYGSDSEGVAARESLAGRLAVIDAVAHAQDNREHDILDSDDYWQFAGGLAATAKVLQGRSLPVYFSDTAMARPGVRRLDEEIARVVRARAVNPKWISAMMRHGHKGAMEIAATVDFLFAFAATADVVRDHHFEAVYQAYLGDEAVRDFLARENRGALDAIARRLGEAIRRGLWTPRSNSIHAMLDTIGRADA
jgi:cobaltochelatase CobN